MHAGRFLTMHDEAWGRAGLIEDPKDAGTIITKVSGRVELITASASAETRTLGDPLWAGQIIQLEAKTITSAAITVTVTNGYHSTGATSLVFDAAGDMVRLVGTTVGSNFRWRLQTSDGVEVPATPLSSITLDDNSPITFGDGSDSRLLWNGSYLAGGPATGMWAGAPSKADPNYMAVAYEVEDHFISTPDVTNLWTAANVGTGTTAYDPAVAGGVLLMTCQATTDDAAEQLTRKGAGFLLAAGKTVWYETRLKIVGDIQSEVSFGLVADGEDLTAVADVLPADGVSISNQDGSLANALTLSKDGTNTGAVAAINTMVTNVYDVYGLLIDGLTSVTPYINGVAGTAATATFNDDEAMAPYFLVRNGDGTTQQVLHVDWLRCVQLR